MWVGVTGYAQHGKDTVADLLVREFGFTRRAFADQLKSMALVLDPAIPLEYEADVKEVMRAADVPVTEFVRLAPFVNKFGWEAAKQLVEVRRFLQVLGTEAVRDHLGENSWVEALAARAQDDINLVIPDVRFPNEGKFVEENGVLLAVRRLNPDFTPFDNGIGTEHPSEANVAGLIRKADALFTATSVEELENDVRAWVHARQREGAL
jgi:hypothetical protein